MSEADKVRNSRLSWSNQAQYRLQQELNEVALQKCADQVKAFADCSKDSGFLVIWSCREQNKAMNECLHSYTSQECLEAYQREREQQLMVKANKQEV
uniref:COX assembly mitochondrial protein n=1 Tax=Fibrocapsa japonica TaxID=94617 RepID=A0A7S2US42_9STRA|eukprot:CAMPEP_0113938562 /NCGR_PEP_ID=MMETSP1339-20121228/4990_1 /TAXON_ID=94617 /ORGANISM="Fibrocapsa japonica" /LENGTH=96 /DNA_ID=CAMNT_0000941739 /DNA_START=25 /DNA_END=315 /DNA_ORIENTATION=+ /assembly_acc=CAM_ASM_000762